MIRQLKKITRQIVAGANVATILIILIIGFSGYVNPAGHPFFSNIGLAFPVFLVVNLGFLVFWLIFKPKWTLIPFLGFVICYVPVRTYIPFNVPHDPPADAIKVLSYNVCRFVTQSVPEGEPNPIVDYIIEQDADIVCLQESMAIDENDAGIDSILSKHYKYGEMCINRYWPDGVSIYSKYPILSCERIKYESKGNLSMACKVKIDGDTVLVINNHLETTGLSIEDRKNFKDMLKGKLDTEASKGEAHTIMGKLAEASRIRGPQAVAVARYISARNNMSVICCGDFNDSPLSYTHRKLAADLTDCYTATGNGPGISYHYNFFYVRIDNILCSSDWTPYNCKVDSKIKRSDHYPIYCWLKKR